jgi:hypothetical protein
VKQYTTRFLKSVAVLYMGFPAVYIIFAALLFDVPANQCVRLLLSPSYYLLSAMAIVAGYGLWEMRRWGWYVFLISNIFVAYTNAVVVSEYGETHHKVIAFILSILFLVLLIFRVSKEVRVPYFLPRIRWWESNPRYRLSVPVQVTRKDQPPFQAEILDLSMGGCFIKLRNDVAMDEVVSVQFNVFGAPIQVIGTVVWRTQSTVTHPKGVGLKFGSIPRIQRRTLKAVCQRLKKLSSFYRSSRYLMNQDDFAKRFDEMQSANLTILSKLNPNDK